ncbi:protein-disulfide isomerase [Mycolicibacterium phlei RIVM601174]|nr:protein-disulfide isomerase [Mycolicibacterium phlei RIVM601174]MBF4195020.1 protein-disulfide isomerase [Mycolicibacterium phlei]
MVVTMLVALVAVVGCTKQIDGTALRDPVPAPLGVSRDGYGVVAGFDSAPYHIEIFTEPQCNHCADLQADFGDQLRYYIDTGALQVTYRPLTFLDDRPGGHSARVANALFLAAESGASGAQFQRFVQQLWAHQEPGGPGPSDDEMAEMARAAGMPGEAADRIASGGPAVDVADMDTVNFGYLYEIDNLTTGTPTVYDLVADKRLDIYDDDWLVRLMQS